MNKLHSLRAGNWSCRKWSLPMLLPLLLLLCNPSFAMVVVNGPPTIVDASCASLADGSFTLDYVSDMGGNITYSIDGAPAVAGPTFSGFLPGSYAVTIFDDADGDTDNVVIVVGDAGAVLDVDFSAIAPTLDFECVENVPTGDASGIVVNTSCGAVTAGPDFTDSDNGGSGCVGDELVITRTYFVEDEGGNRAEFDQVITIADMTAPTLTCGGPFNVECSDDISAPGAGGASFQIGTGSSTAAPTGGIGATIEDGTPVDVTFDVSVPAGSTITDVTVDIDITHSWVGDLEIDLISPGGTSIELLYDPCGNGNFDDLNITVSDGGASIVSAACGNPTTGVFAPENLSGDVLGDFAGEDPNGTWTMRITDDAGGDEGNYNGGALNVSFASGTPAVAGVVPLPAVLDNCLGLIDVSHNDVTTPGTCANEFTVTRTWTATDACGNSMMCDQIINVSDNTNPVITSCPAPVTQACDASRDPALTGLPTATDNCSAQGDIALTFNDGPIVGPCANTGAIERTWTATDECGNTATCIQVINVFDFTPPVMSCPADITLSCGDNTAPGNAMTGNVSGSQAANVSWADGDIGAFPSNISVSAPAGAMIENVTVDVDVDHSWVADLELQLTSPSGTTIMLMGSDCGSSDNLSATFSDAGAARVCDLSFDGGATDVGTPNDCSSDYLAGASTSGVILPVDLLSAFDGEDPSGTWVLTATDGTGGDGGCIMNATVNVDYLVAASGGGLAGFGTAVDNCSGMVSVTHADAIIPGNCPGNYVIERTWTAIDECGLSNQCVQRITVVDDMAPAITCPAPASVECGGDTSVGALGTATATDNCDADVAITFSDSFVADATCPQGGTLTRTWTATDDCGMTATCDQIITITDNTAPVIAACPANMALSCDESTDPNFTGRPAAVDACDPMPTSTFSDVASAGACAQEQTITRTWTVSDACGNTATCVQTLTITDNDAPIITCPADMIVECSDDYSPGTMTTTTGTTTGTAPANSVSWADLTTGNVGDITIPVTVPAGGTITDVEVSLSVDHSWLPDLSLTLTSPSGTSINLVTNLCGAGNTDNADVTFSDAGAAAACTAGVFSDVGDPNDCSSDYLGGTAVSGVILPEQAMAAFAGESPDGDWVIGVSDSAGGDGGCIINASIDVSWTATSGGGGGGGQAAAVDNCDPNPVLTSSDFIIPGVCANSFVVERTWVATDACGNSSSCTQTIVVQDTTDPVITCPADVTVECDQDSSPAGTGSATATDNCTASPVITSSDNIIPGSCTNTFTIERTWTATDECGNTATCLQTINVEDTTPPVAPAAPAAITVQCPQDIPAPTSLTATDNCAGDITVMPTYEITDQDCATRFTYTYTWSFDDGCGNRSSVSQAITVEDTGVITFASSVPNQTVDCAVNVIPQDHLVEAVTPCGNPATITSSVSAPIGTPGCNGTRYIVTYTASDDCGRSATTTQTFTIQNDGPEIVCGTQICDIECGTSNEDILAQFNAWADDALVINSCEEAVVTVTNNFNPATLGTTCGSQRTVRFRATDACGRFSTCDVTVRIVDDIAPVVNGQAYVGIRECGDMLDLQYADWANSQIQALDVTDNCGEVIATYSPPSPNTGFGADGIAATGVTFTFRDGCGNQTQVTGTFKIRNNFGPTFIGELEDKMITCPATPVFDTPVWINGCNGAQLTFEDETDGGSCPSGYTVTRTWTATDGQGGVSTIQQTVFVMGSTVQMANVAGLITTEFDEPVEEVEVSLNTNGTNYAQEDMTAADGLFEFATPMHSNYEVSPLRNDDHRNGVSTFDLLLLKQHLLGLQSLDTPYKLIAADVNNSGSITSLDMIALRRLILFVDDEFASNTSWRFVDAAYQFADASNPFATTFPESYLINDLDASIDSDFIAVKIGDLNGSAAANELMAGDVRSKDGNLVFDIQDRMVKAGETFEVSFDANQFEDVLGYQFTMKYNNDLVSFVDVAAGELSDMNADNFGVRFDEGIITTSWNADKAITLADKLSTFTVTFTANENVRISEALALSNAYTPAEAYNANGDLLDVQLRFGGADQTAGAFALFQNEPNPFRDVTRIGFELPEAGQATLTIFDVAGKVVHQITENYAAGYNEEVIDRSDLSADGMLFYRLESGDHVATQKMIIIRK